MLDEKTREQAPEMVPTKRTPWRTAAIAVLTLMVVVLGAWALAERSEAAGLAADLSEAETQIVALEAANASAASQAAWSDVAVVGGNAMTERQQEMVALVTGPWIEAWSAADGEAVSRFYTGESVQYDIEGTETLRISDGTLQAFASRWPGIGVEPGMLVHGDRVHLVVETGGTYVGAVLEFTDFGELLIESTAMYDSELAGDLSR